MSRGLSNLELVREIEKTYFEGITDFYARGPTTKVEREEGLIIFQTGLGSPMLNGVLSCDSAGATEAEARSLVGRFQKAGLPMIWAAGPSAPLDRLDRIMSDIGLAAEPRPPGMALELEGLQSTPLPKGLQVDVADSRMDLETCTGISAEVFGIPPGSLEGWRAMVHGYGTGPGHRWFIGTLDGDPVSISLLVMHDKVAGIYNVATLDKARGKGVGTALTREPLLFAKRAGYEIAVLEASEMGRPIYEKLGFRKVCEFGVYAWMPGSPPTGE
jgi:GNAT superfamily N-acetyltransferase